MFPEVAPPRVTATGLLAVVAALVAGTALVLARQTGVGALDTLYAEDGVVFLTTARRMSLWSGLWEPFAGYMHLVPRLLAEPISALSLDRSAEAMAVTAAVGAALLALVAYRSLAGHITSPIIRGIAALGVLALPVGQEEVFSVVANLHWLLVPVAALVLLWNPQARVETVVAAFVVFLAAASDPMAVVLVPLAAIRLAAPLSRWAKVPTAALVAGLLVQALVVAGGSDTREFTEPIRDPAKLLIWLLFDVPARTVGGTRWVGGISEPSSWVAAAVAITALAVFVAVCWRTLARRELLVPAALATTGLLLYLAYAGVSGERPPRYGVPSGILLIVAIAICVDRLRRKLAPRQARRWAIAVGAAVALVWAVNLRIDTGRSDGPGWSTELAAARERCEADGAITVAIPITPDRRFAVELPCADLDGGG
jgi:hypothetical protein